MNNQFGIINTYIEEIKKKITKNKLSLNEFNDFKNKLNSELKIDKNIINEICNKLFKNKYILNNKLCFENGKNCFRELENLYPDIIVPDEYIELEKQFNKLKLLPQPEQRTKEWYDYRYNRVTASDTCAAIDLNPYETVEQFILKKCDPNFPFRDNENVHHGKKYETIATLIYEHVFNVRVFEFGALPSEKYNFLGASPDGICSKYTLDNKFSEKLGTMLEIKCPIKRNIVLKGAETDICPFYYYCQVQQQLECCELTVCDFWQCSIVEYSRNDYLNDNTTSIMYTNTDELIIDNKYKKGIILEYYPKNFTPEFDGDSIEWKSKYIYPKQLDMNELEYNEWIIKMLEETKIDGYYFNRLIYWKLKLAHNLPIIKNDVFLNKIIPILKNTWEQVQYYRKNLNRLDDLKEINDRRSKFIRFNTNYKVYNINTISNTFLNSNYNLEKIHKNIKKINKKIDIESDNEILK
jgi:putative phage-type endonuclease